MYIRSILGQPPIAHEDTCLVLFQTKKIQNTIEPLNYTIANSSMLKLSPQYWITESSF